MEKHLSKYWYFIHYISGNVTIYKTLLFQIISNKFILGLNETVITNYKIDSSHGRYKYVYIVIILGNHL